LEGRKADGGALLVGGGEKVLLGYAETAVPIVLGVNGGRRYAKARCRDKRATDRSG